MQGRVDVLSKCWLDERVRAALLTAVVRTGEREFAARPCRMMAASVGLAAFRITAEPHRSLALT